MNKNVYIEHSSYEYVMMFIKLGYTVVNSPDKANLICFTGGADVSPHLYGDTKHPATFNDPYRDAKEERMFQYALEKNIPMVGICRGGQFLNVMSGGRMYQHVAKHTMSHAIIDVDSGKVVWVSSTHHQMMLPSDKAKLVAYAEQKGKREWFDGAVARSDISNEDIEVVYYEHTNCLCFQPHPEFVSEDYEGMLHYFGELLKQYLIGEQK